MALYGLVVCGGRSSRMGTDKSQLSYFGKPQYEHVSGLLTPFCEKVVISCNEKQFQEINTDREKLVDVPEFAGNGPIAAILTAFQAYPNQDWLVVGCDYPFLSNEEIGLFLKAIQGEPFAAAFYNQNEKYEPLLAWYSLHSAPLVRSRFSKGDFSIQYFLKSVDARKYIPKSPETMISVDTPEDFTKTIEQIKRNQNLRL